MLRQFARYITVGAVGTLAHLAILVLCVEGFGWNPVSGSVGGFLCALLVCYWLNHRWTFESQRSHITSLWRYVVVSLSGLALNTGMMAALVHYLHWWYLTAQLSVIFIVPVSNFALNRYWTFDAAKRSENI